MGYTLQDLYVIFQQAETQEGKLELLHEWSEMRLGFNINWEGLIGAWS